MIKNLFLLNEDGQGMVEYGLIVGLVALVCIVGLTVLGDTISTIFNEPILHESFMK